MTLTQTIIEQAVGLSARDRLKIVDSLLISLDEPSLEFDQLWAEEANKRLAAYRRGEMGTKDVESVLGQFRRE
ncbi:addiction module protein [Acidithiobacillus concretivorus]|uniref:Addiction module protein n=1 Tax=Acidithiobacillus concretivorus TaxID=3063952 RepID=A0ABS5ZS69_9PROT|nr:addiction module protein [Acidithiobacillus concretivorus]MBU2739524.1 addiction module protein [Acidithiobacillus concretivorus]